MGKNVLKTALMLAAAVLGMKVGAAILPAFGIAPAPATAPPAAQ